MATTKNITMKQFNGTDYDTLYPKTNVKQIENLTPSSIGAVAKSGDTMTGRLEVAYEVLSYNASATPGTNHKFILRPLSGINVADLLYDTGDNCTCGIRFLGPKNSLTNIISLIRSINGGWEEYQILHTGNAQTLGFPKIAIGSYVGTGTSDPFNGTKQNSLTFDFEPKMLAVVADGKNMFFPGFLIVRGQTFSDGIGSFSGGSVSFDLHITWSGNTVSWWSSNRIDIGTKYPQMNAENTTYRYVALG